MMHDAAPVETVLPAHAQQQTFGLSWPLLIGAAAFLIPVYLGWGLSDPDTYWHIAAGRWMAQQGSVPTHDFFSYSMHGAPWSAHEWDAELLIFLTYRMTGWAGLVLLASASFSLTMAYVTRFLLARMEPLYALVFTLLGGVMMFPSLLARPHTLVWPLTALWVGTLVQCSEARRVPPWWLLGVMLLWVNFHGSFIIGLGFALALAVESVQSGAAARSRIAIGWALFILACLACALLNPQGYHALLFPFDLMGMKTALALITEWRPPNFQEPQLLSLWLLLIAGLAFSGRMRLPWVRSMLVIGLIYMALQHQRNIALLGMTAPLLFAGPSGAAQSRAAESGDHAERLDQWFRALSAPAATLTTGISLWLVAITAAVFLQVRNPQPPAYTTPRLALEALLATGTRGRILNAYGFGGYLIFRGIPVFIDGRADLYGEKFVRESAQALWLEEHGPGLEALLARYHINATLLAPNTPALQLLDRLPQWQRIYSDESAVVHIRRVPLATP